MGLLSKSLYTHAPEHDSSTGQTLDVEVPRILERKIVSADPRIFPEAILRMKPGMSISVGQALIQGGSKQNRHLLASISASETEYKGFTS